MYRIVVLLAISIAISSCNGSITSIHQNTNSDDCSNAKANKKIQSVYSIETLFDMTAEEAEEWRTTPNEDRPVNGYHYYNVDTTYNNNCLLSVVVTFDYTGAYPSTAFYYFTFDKNTGEQLDIYDIVNEGMAAPIISKYTRRVETIIAEGRKELSDKEELYSYNNQIEQYRNFNFPHRIEDFYITEEGFVFVIPFDFPHVVQALQPNNIIEIPKNDIAPYLIEGAMLNLNNW
ncbi:MAG: hypothetical protein R2800_04705 [Flavipsychrobacter sp.]